MNGLLFFKKIYIKFYFLKNAKINQKHIQKDFRDSDENWKSFIKTIHFKNLTFVSFSSLYYYSYY